MVNVLTKSTLFLRLLTVLAIAVTVSACDNDNPGAPTSANTLPSGDYVLRVTVGNLPPIGGPPLFCGGTAGNLSATGAFPVRVTGSGGTWMVQMPQSSGPGGGSLQISLSGSGTLVSGTITGSARTADGAVSVTVSVPTALSGTVQSTTTVVGQINGNTQLETARGTVTCTAGGWTLDPQ
jgi:hypothetical protein